MKRRAANVLGSALFFLVAPGTVAGLVPYWLTGWRLRPPLLGFVPFRLLGGALIAAGLAVLLDSFARFALRGRGTPAPVLPTEHLVISGLYRFVRNPMYVAVTSLVLGQALLLGSVVLLVYSACVWLVMHVFVLAYEEPTLRRSFGDEYRAFCAAVPRWIPRPTPWKREDARA
jgi:protein-S-isoprenylcysteine O-methyltransferase Ste14